MADEDLGESITDIARAFSRKWELHIPEDQRADFQKDVCDMQETTTRLSARYLTGQLEPLKRLFLRLQGVKF